MDGLISDGWMGQRSIRSHTSRLTNSLFPWAIWALTKPYMIVTFISHDTHTLFSDQVFSLLYLWALFYLWALSDYFVPACFILFLYIFLFFCIYPSRLYIVLLLAIYSCCLLLIFYSSTVEVEHLQFCCICTLTIKEYSFLFYSILYALIGHNKNSHETPLWVRTGAHFQI